MKERLLRVLSARRSKKGQEGVTLIELLAVIVILAIIAGVAVPVVLHSINNAKINTTKQSEAVIAEALSRYAAENNGTYPLDSSTATTGNTADVTNALVGNYLQSMPTDGWGGNFTITTTGNSYTITSSTFGSSNTVTMNSSNSTPTVN